MIFLRIGEVIQRVGLSKGSIYRMESMGLFPHRKKIGLKTVAWLESEINEWIRSRSNAISLKNSNIAQK